MDGDPPRWWKQFKLNLLLRWPIEPRKKIKRLIQIGDVYTENGDKELAQWCYERSMELAENASAVHLRKKLEDRFQEP